MSTIYLDAIEQRQRFSMSRPEVLDETITVTIKHEWPMTTMSGTMEEWDVNFHRDENDLVFDGVKYHDYSNDESTWCGAFFLTAVSMAIETLRLNERIEFDELVHPFDEDGLNEFSNDPIEEEE